MRATSAGLLCAVTVGAAACGDTVTTTSTHGAGGAASTTTGATGATVASTTSASTVSATSSTGDNGMVSTKYPAPHPAAPKVEDFGGPVLAKPRIVPVFFMNDSFQTQLVDFETNLGATSYWAATTSEYGVGPITATAPVVVSDIPPMNTDDTGIQTWLTGKLNGNDPLWPVADENTIYVLHYPASTTITLQSQQGASQSCSSFGGYHDSVTLDAAHGSASVAYAVIPRCSNFGGLGGLDGTTGAESHELIEASTDPFPNNMTAYGQVDNAHLYWELALGGGEVGDMCAQSPGAFTKFSPSPYEVQRTWSNASAKASHDPCVPELAGEVYFAAAPVLNDMITFQGVGTMQGVKIPVGSSKTIDLDLFSDGDTGGPFDVQALDLNSLMGGPSSMSFSLDRTQGQNGEILHLTITVNSAPQFGAGIFVVISSIGNQTNGWLGLVGTN